MCQWGARPTAHLELNVRATAHLNVRATAHLELNVRATAHLEPSGRAVVFGASLRPRVRAFRTAKPGGSTSTGGDVDGRRAISVRAGRSRPSEGHVRATLDTCGFACRSRIEGERLGATLEMRERT